MKRFQFLYGWIRTFPLHVLKRHIRSFNSSTGGLGPVGDSGDADRYLGFNSSTGGLGPDGFDVDGYGLERFNSSTGGLGLSEVCMIFCL